MHFSLTVLFVCPKCLWVGSYFSPRGDVQEVPGWNECPECDSQLTMRKIQQPFEGGQNIV